MLQSISSSRLATFFLTQIYLRVYPNTLLWPLLSRGLELSIPSSCPLPQGQHSPTPTSPPSERMNMTLDVGLEPDPRDLSTAPALTSSPATNSKFTLTIDCDGLLKPSQLAPNTFVTKTAVEAAEYYQLPFLLAIPMLQEIKIKCFPHLRLPGPRAR
ncbi:uncharacterized protein EI97DRAFT_203522 [Westerdykella ornata]|uniref:Uncharacterized protein n=1 Tax=Westerdykella ornata TaxID=318751 RepID=A0A6A6JBY1_WESOR|nr:uncharacterized protein EI97DRAFT_203522 [Westerdykella ornata]KAF2272699.1 hypothetical protein EI97DRAFT_203522 [Westerdykella ornata]